MDVDVNQVISVIGLISVVGGVYAALAYQRIKTGFGLFVAMFNQDAELLNAVNVALADDKITEEEFGVIYKEFQDSAKATQALLQNFKQ
jgi:hypothetical protein